ncbi:MAG: VWA domain-containing protein [Candidatus Altiarchaeota archaeon]
MNESIAAAKIEFDLFGTPAGFMYPEYLLILLPLLAFFAAYLLRGKATKTRIGFLLVRSVIILLVAMALASPLYYKTHKTVDDAHPITVLLDSSPSMRLYPDAPNTGYAIYDRIKTQVGNLTGSTQNVKIEYVSDGNRTAIGDAIYHNMVQYGGQPMTMVVISDGQNNHGRNPVDMAKVLAQTNSTIYSLKPAKKADDIYIQAAVGDKKIPANTKYDLLLRIASTADREVSYDINVYVDGIRRFYNQQPYKQAEPLKDIPLILSIKDIGVHEIKVELDTGGRGFPENDVYYKTVKVVEKPKILYVTGNSSSPMLDALKKLYEVEVTRQVDNDYGKYAGLIFDNINEKDFDRNIVNRIRKYVMEEGNGVAFIGGRNSFEYGGYNNSFVENILPVKSTDKPVERRRDFAIVFLIDVSESTEYGTGADSKIDVEKAVALRMLSALNANDSVGVYAFNTNPYVVTPLTPLGPKFDDTWQTIRELRFGGGTDIQSAIEAAESDLRGKTVDKYLIIISDGVIRSTRMQMAIDRVGQMKDEGIKTFTVGVGFDTDEQFMDDMARAGGGQYFSLKSNPDNRLKIVFGDQADDKTKDTTPVVMTDDYHYITRSLPDLQEKGTAVSGFNKVHEKSVAQMLLSTKGGKPILTVWNFGLGRVAALTSDNGLQWGQDLISVDSGKVVSAMTNWIIGDLEKGKAIRISSQDASLGNPVLLQVKAPALPHAEAKNAATGDAPLVLLTRTSLNSYTGSFMPKDLGFYGIIARLEPKQDLDAVAVNYPGEYSPLGIDEDTLRRIAATTGSRVYTEAEATAMADDIISRLKETSTLEIRDPQDLWAYFGALALCLYFLDTAARRIIAILRRGEEKGDDEKPTTKLSSL